MKNIYTRGISPILIIVIIAIFGIVGYMYFTRDETTGGDEAINEIVDEELGRLMEGATTTDPNSLPDEATLLEEQNSMDAEPKAL